MSRTHVVAAVLIAGLVGVPTASAVFTYGNLNGTSVVYQDIQENSITDPGIALYGAPSILGDALMFSPMNFGIESHGAGASDYMDGTLAAKLNSIAGYTIEKIKFTERGDYSLLGTGTSATHASIGNLLIITITGLTGPALSEPIEVPGINMTFTPSGGYYSLPGNQGQNVYWQGSTVFDVTGWLNANGYAGRRATKVEISMDNSLRTASEAGTDAYIQKKRVGSAITIEPITPEPASLALLMLGGLFLKRRR